ncbi:MAG: hypothetical protein LBM75_07325, partial [Myxococcales bacterium]|nr:hypothetical protein [Myxococcales bacterium]
MSQMKLPQRSGALSRNDAASPRQERDSDASEAEVPKKASARLKLPLRSQQVSGSRSLSGVHRAVQSPSAQKAPPVIAQRVSPTSSPSLPTSTASAGDDGWDWDAPPAAVAEPVATAPRTRPSSASVPVSASAAQSRPQADLFDEGERTHQASGLPKLSRKATPASTKRRSPSDDMADERLVAVEAALPRAPQEAMVARSRLSRKASPASTSALSRQDEARAPLLSASSRALTDEIDEDRQNLARKATPPLEIAALSSPKAAEQVLGPDRARQNFSRKETPPLEFSAVSPKEVTQSLDLESVRQNLSRKATPPLDLALSVPLPRAETRAIDDVASAEASSIDADSDAVVGALSPNVNQEATSFEVPENA